MRCRIIGILAKAGREILGKLARKNLCRLVTNPRRVRGDVDRGSSLHDAVKRLAGV